MTTLNTLQLPGIFSQPTTLTRTLAYETSTFGQRRALRVFSDLQHDLSVVGSYYQPEAPLSPESALLLAAGMNDVREGSVSEIPPELLEGSDED